MENDATRTLVSEIEELFAARDWAGLRRRLAETPAPEVADVLGELGKAERAFAFRLLPRELAAEVLSLLEPSQQNALLTDLNEDETRQLLATMRPDDRTQLLEELPGMATQRLLNLLSASDLAEARHLLGYPEDSVGRLMTPDYVAVRPHWTVGQALQHIRRRGRDSETINTIYVTDDHWVLQDAVELRRFILADPEAPVSEIMDHSFVSVSAFADREESVRLIQRYDLDALPVVGSDGVLLGIVTIDDVLDVAEEETTEDFHKTAAIAPLLGSYREATVWSVFRRRVGWLLVLVVVNLASSGVIAAYEEVLASTIALAFFIPLLIDSGGNAGAQSATLMVRALATGDLHMRHWLATLGKEVGIGAFLGVSMGLASALLGLFRGGPTVAIIVGLSMISIVLTANLIGVVLPFLLTRLRVDPAVASSPLITTLADATGLLIYFSIATAIMGRVHAA